jgi:single-strand DNA-binding protein
MYNRVILMGRLTKDPELRTTQSGVTMCRITVAVDRNFVKQGEERQADFLDVVCWRQTAEFVCKYFTKGRPIHIEGRIQNDNYTDQNGNKVYRNTIVADNVAFCGDKRADGGSGNYGGQQYGGNSYGGQSQYQQNAPQKPAAPAPQAAFNQAPNPIEYGGVNDFEEVISDSDVPF